MKMTRTLMLLALVSGLNTAPTMASEVAAPQQTTSRFKRIGSSIANTASKGWNGFRRFIGEQVFNKKKLKRNAKIAGLVALLTALVTAAQARYDHTLDSVELHDKGLWRRGAGALWRRVSGRFGEYPDQNTRIERARTVLRDRGGTGDLNAQALYADYLNGIDPQNGIPALWSGEMAMYNQRVKAAAEAAAAAELARLGISTEGHLISPTKILANHQQEARSVALAAESKAAAKREIIAFLKSDTVSQIDADRLVRLARANGLDDYVGNIRNKIS